MSERPKFKLFHWPMSRSTRVKWLLHEILGQDFETETIELYDGEQYSPEFLAINPNHAVPVLQVTPTSGEPFTLLESGAMITWLADAYPEAEFAPVAYPPSAARGDYLQMLYFCAGWFDMMLWQLRVQRDLTMPDKRDERTIRNFTRKIATEVEPQLVQRLSDGGYATGQRFTAADCVLGHNIRWARFYGLCGDAVFDQYLDRLAERPAYQLAFSDVGEFILRPPGIPE